MNAKLSICSGIIALLFSPATFSTELPSLEKVLNQYLVLESTLSSDSLDKAKETASGIVNIIVKQNIKDKALETAAVQLRDAKDLKVARKNFKTISYQMIAWVKASKRSDLSIVYCSMAGAKWVQENGPISNPYMGKEMAGCGEKVNE